MVSIKNARITETNQIKFDLCGNWYPLKAWYDIYKIRPDTGTAVFEAGGEPILSPFECVPIIWGDVISDRHYSITVGQIIWDGYGWNKHVDEYIYLYSKKAEEPDVTIDEFSLSETQVVPGDTVSVSISLNNNEDSNIYAKVSSSVFDNDYWAELKPGSNEMTDMDFTMPDSDTTLTCIVETSFNNADWYNLAELEKSVEVAEPHTSCATLDHGDDFIEIKLVRSLFDYVDMTYNVELWKCISPVGCMGTYPHGWFSSILGPEPSYELVSTTNVSTDGYACFEEVDAEGTDYAVVVKDDFGIKGQLSISNTEEDFNKTLIMPLTGGPIDKLVVIAFAAIAILVLLNLVKR